MDSERRGSRTDLLAVPKVLFMAFLCLAGPETQWLKSGHQGGWLRARLHRARQRGLKKATEICLKTRSSLLPLPEGQGLSLSKSWEISCQP